MTEKQTRRRWRAAACALLAQAVWTQAQAADLWHVDRYDEREDTGISSRQNQKRIDAVAITGAVGMALWEGTDTRLGHAAWSALDAALMTAGTTEAMKRVFHRPRPAQNPDPGTWFQSSRDRSFPSGETAMMAALVTPFVREYHADEPEAWALAALPLYMAQARMASQGHWLTDVAAGGAIGAAYGYYAAGREVPLVLAVGHRSAFVGLRYRY